MENVQIHSKVSSKNNDKTKANIDFEREINICKHLNKKNGGKCAWGTCNQCGVIPMLYKLYKGITEEDKVVADKMRKEIFG